MKKLFLLLLAVLLALPAFAFEYTYEGQTLVYRIIDEDTKTVSVGSENVTGDLTIPAYASYEGVSYTVISIEDFSYSSLTSVTIPNSVTYIGVAAFYGCSCLTSVTIPNSVTSIGRSTFSYCSSLSSVTIPNSVTSIGMYAFYYCSNLTSVTIPNSVTSIGMCAFLECNSLISVTIPNSVTYIGGEAFAWCPNLTSVYYNTTEPIVGYKNIFYGISYATATLYVPESAIETFKHISPWMEFQNIQGYNFQSGLEDITAGFDESAPCEYFSLSGLKMGSAREALAPGIYIARQGGKAKKITVK